MAKILLYTIHDYACSGIRMLGAYARAKGHDARLIFMGSAEGFIVSRKLNEYSIQEDLKDDPTFIVFSNGVINLSDSNSCDFDIPEAFLSFLEDWQPDIVGLSCRSILTPYFKDWFSSIRKASPSSLIIAGGFGPTLEPDIYLDRGADCVIRGEGEEVLAELAECIDKKRSYFDIKNLVFRNNGKTVTMPLRPLIKNLDILPQQLQFDKGIYVIENDTLIERDPFTNADLVFLSRGCIGSCSYCSAGHLIDIYRDDKITLPRYRYPSNDKCLNTFKQMKLKGAQAIVMQDDYFVRPYEMMKDFFTRYKQEIGLPFWGYLHYRFIDNHPDILKMAIDSGLISLSLPIQSADVYVNKYLFNRESSLESVLKYAHLVNSQFIPFDTHFIDGFFAENTDMEIYLEKNLNFIKKLPQFHPGFPELIRYTISYLRLHLNSPLLKAQKTKKMPYREFFFRAMLMLFRYILDDEGVEALKCNSIYKKSPEPLLDLFNETKGYLHKEYIVSMARRFSGRDVLIWGCGSVYSYRKPLFVGMKPQAIVVDIPVPECQVDGIPVLKLQEVIKNKENYLPVFICIKNSQACARRLKEICPDYPKEYIIGFGEF